MKHRKLTAVLVAVLAALLTGSCDDDVTGPGEGSIEVRLAMTGNAPDLDGCTVSVDGGPERAIFAGESVLFTSLQAG
ncbi:MAG: hypothetical protein GTN93_22980, partial [Anaerolineae bacterium]|nr:hypothetical protein [Anaerolineae bacterium]NIQ80903.1 hypothetical protein [Anaerolineae bacterium]